MKIINLVSLSLNIIMNCPLYLVHTRVPRIIGGTDPEPEDIKFLVSVQIRDFHMCGGAIIDDKFVLTAAHCVIDTTKNQFIPGPYKIVAGTKNRSDSDAIFVDVEKIFVPKAFHIPKSLNEAWNADIAVLSLKQSLNLSSNERLQKLLLATEANSLTNVKAKIAGFGTDRYERFESPFGGSYDVHSVSGQAHQINLTIMETSKCHKFSPRKLSDTEFCAKISEPNVKIPAGICRGDSGSPLVYNDDTVIGVAARSDLPCNQNNMPAYYTSVSSYIDFIQDAMNDKTSDMRTIKV